MNVLVFRIKGPYAHFRRVYTTTSASSYSFPTRTAILGMIGAILGIERKARAEHLKYLKDLNVAVSLEKPVQKMRFPLNYQSIKESKRIQIPLEVIKNSSYLIFVEEFELYEKLKTYLKNKETVFTPYLGISEFIASLEYIGEYELKEASLPCKVSSVLPSSKVKIKPEKGVLYLRERATRSMDERRNYIEHETYILRKDAKPIIVTEGEVFSVGRWNITWL